MDSRGRAFMVAGLLIAMHARGQGVLAQDRSAGAAEQAVGQSKAAEIKVEGMLVHSGFNTDWQKPGKEDLKSELDGVIEGAVSFMVNIPFEKLAVSLERPESLGNLSANIEDYKVAGKEEADDRVVYHIEETLVPFPIPGVRSLLKKKVYLRTTVLKRAQGESTAVVRWELEPGKPSGWQRFNGSLQATDLHTGHTLILVHTSTRSGYTLPASLRLQLASRFLSSTRDNLVKWMSGL